jgi:hypothetical protein
MSPFKYLRNFWQHLSDGSSRRKIPDSSQVGFHWVLYLEPEELPPCLQANRLLLRVRLYRILGQIMTDSLRVKAGSQVVLPSLSEMAHYYESSEVEILGILQKLRRKGFIYDIQGLDVPIAIYDRKSPHNPHLSRFLKEMARNGEGGSNRKGSLSCGA